MRGEALDSVKLVGSCCHVFEFRKSKHVHFEKSSDSRNGSLESDDAKLGQ